MARTPLSGLPAVHTDWAVERRGWMGRRKTWTTVLGDVSTTEFTLGDGAVAVTAGRHRVFTDAEYLSTYDPDESLPDPAADVFRKYIAPEEREATFRLVERYLPAGEPVTVVGVPGRAGEPGQLVVDEAPPDDLFGTHADYTTSQDTAPEAVLVQGDADEAERRLRRTVYAKGGGGLAMVVGGQWLAFRFSSASLDALVTLGP